MYGMFMHWPPSTFACKCDMYIVHFYTRYSIGPNETLKSPKQQVGFMNMSHSEFKF